MGKNSVVRKLQNAHLYAWLGDYQKASEIIEEIQNSNEKLASVLRPTLQEKEKEYKEKIQFDSSSINELNKNLGRTINQIEINSVSYGSPKKELVPPSHSILENSKTIDSMKWKYSINTVSISLDLTRLEIRAFNPNDSIPQNFTLHNFTFSNWIIEYGEEKTNKDSFNLRWLYLVNPILDNESINIYVAIDRWGLLSGTAIGPQEKLEDILGYLHSLLSNLDNIIWKD